MSELTEFISNSQPISIRKLCKLLFDQHTIQKLSYSDSSTFFTDILMYISNSQPQRSEKEQDQIKLILLIFLIAYKPPSKIIQFNFPFDTQNGYIFASSLVVYSMISKEKNYILFFPNGNLNSFYNPISSNEKYEKFFSISPCYYYQILPTFLSDQILDPQFAQILSNILQPICNLKSENLNLSIITFISEIYKSITNCIMRKPNSPLPNYFLESIIY